MPAPLPPPPRTPAPCDSPSLPEGTAILSFMLIISLLAIFFLTKFYQACMHSWTIYYLALPEFWTLYNGITLHIFFCASLLLLIDPRRWILPRWMRAVIYLFSLLNSILVYEIHGNMQQFVGWVYSRWKFGIWAIGNVAVNIHLRETHVQLRGPSSAHSNDVFPETCRKSRISGSSPRPAESVCIGTKSLSGKPCSGYVGWCLEAVLVSAGEGHPPLHDELASHSPKWLRCSLPVFCCEAGQAFCFLFFFFFS